MRLPLVATLVTLLAFVIMLGLGTWQLQRAEHKYQRLAKIEQLQSHQGIGLQQAIEMAEQALDMPVSFSGKADIQHSFLLDNKVYQGRVGYEVLIPTATSHGTVLVNLGWLPAPGLRSELPLIHFSGEHQHFQGMVAMPKANMLVSETVNGADRWPLVIQQVDVGLMSELYGHPLLPFVVLLDAQPDSPFERHWQAVVMPPEKHIAYAIQWFLLALASLIIFIVAQRKKRSERNNGQEKQQ